MSFLSRWQPLNDENAHTALVFGFLRHAPAQAALDVWLSRTLGRSVSAEPFERSCFWRTVPSVIPGSHYTEPELVLIADDGAPLTVVVEVKPGYDMHAVEQIAREVIDVSHDSRERRIACVMIGADLGRPPSSEGWLEQIIAAAQSHLDWPIDVELHYSSFAELGQVIAECGSQLPEWSRYAADVNAQLGRKGLLGYEGAPMFDDLDGLTTASAVEVFNRTIRAARQFYLQLHGQSGFAALGLGPHEWNYRMLRDGRSDVPTQGEEWFATTVILSLYKHADLSEGSRVFVAFDLLGGGTGDADMMVGLVSFTNTDGLGPYRFGKAIREPERVEGDSPWSERAASGGAAWLYDRRPWRTGQPGEDIEWTISRLAAALRRERSSPDD